MKCFKYSVILTSILFLFACDSDDNTPQPLSQDDIQGEWTLTELNSSEPIDLNNDGIANTDLTQETTCFDGMAVNFENNTYLFTYPKINFTGESNETLECENAINNGTYSLENNVLTATTTINNSTSTESVNVELNNNQLKFTITSAQVSEYLDLENNPNENSELEFLKFVFQK